MPGPALPCTRADKPCPFEETLPSHRRELIYHLPHSTAAPGATIRSADQAHTSHGRARHRCGCPAARKGRLASQHCCENAPSRALTKQALPEGPAPQLTQCRAAAVLSGVHTGTHTPPGCVRVQLLCERTHTKQISGNLMCLIVLLGQQSPVGTGSCGNPFSPT